jgi:hypothetical protein
MLTTYGILLGIIITVFLGIAGSKMDSSDGDFTEKRQKFLDAQISAAENKERNDREMARVAVLQDLGKRAQEEEKRYYQNARELQEKVAAGANETGSGQQGAVLWRWDLVDRNEQYGRYGVSGLYPGFYQPGMNLLLTATFKSDKKFAVGQDLLDVVLKTAGAKTYTVGQHPIPVSRGADGFWSAAAEISVSERKNPCDPCKGKHAEKGEE